MVGLICLAFGVVLAKHGQRREGTYNAWHELISSVILIGLLVAGGFFSPAHAQMPTAANAHKRTLIRAAQMEWGLGAPVAVFAAQVHQESAWRPDAVSHVGARGLAQFMPSTASWWCEINGLTAAQCQPHNATWALRSLVGYDRWLYDRTPAHYSEYDRMWVALRAYNGGMGHWNAEARTTGVRLPTRVQVDAACGRAKRAPVHCRENLGYPDRILRVLQPRYATWGPGLAPGGVP